VARRWPGHFWTTAATLIVERVLDSLCIVLMLGVLIFLIDVPRMVEAAAVVMLVVDVAGVSILVLMAAAPARCLAIIQRLTRRWPRLHARAVRAAEIFLHGLDGIRTLAHVIPVIGWTVAVWSLAALSAWTALKAADLHLPWLAGWVVLTFVGLGVSVPSAPGYVGVFQFAAKLATDLFGVSAAAGLGYGIVFWVSQFVPVTIIGWIYLVREQMTLGEAARVTAAETPPASP
jgi:glycosyltransferase 2 family protein